MFIQANPDYLDIGAGPSGTTIGWCSSWVADIQPNTPQAGWDGHIKGAAALPGVYCWQALIQQSNQERSLQSGELTVTR